MIVISGGLRGEGLACYSTAYQLWSDGLGDTSLVFIDLGSHILMALSIKLFCEIRRLVWFGFDDAVMRLVYL